MKKEECTDSYMQREKKVLRQSTEGEGRLCQHIGRKKAVCAVANFGGGRLQQLTLEFVWTRKELPGLWEVKFKE